jgi:MoxR-like ATPase
VTTAQALYEQVKTELDKVIKGKDEAKKIVFATVLAQGNVLLEGAPGMGKTLMARAMARILGLRFSRIQFTPDLMPSDVLGTNVYHQSAGCFKFLPGPLFADFVLADEVNRAPAKTQAALLEAMEERQISVDNNTYRLSEHFTVFATQNPLEFEGTYALPEAQKDRFMVRMMMDYPDEHDELAILNLSLGGHRDLSLAAGPLSDVAARLALARAEVARVVVDQRLLAYVRDIVRCTRTMDELALGNSPRAGQMLVRLAMAYAAVEGCTFVTPDHVRELVPSVLPHRWELKPEAQVRHAALDDIIRTLFGMVKVPT